MDVPVTKSDHGCLPSPPLAMRSHIMTRTLITAFEPYGPWQQNASWLALMAFTRAMPSAGDITTRLYPVEYAALRERLSADLQLGFDNVLHLGQSPGSPRLQFESIAVNVATDSDRSVRGPLEETGPVAYQSQISLAEFVRVARELSVPACISYHAGTHLCNAAMYWTHHFSAQRGRPVRATLIHVPLEPKQVLDEPAPQACMPTESVVEVLLGLVQQLSLSG